MRKPNFRRDDNVYGKFGEDDFLEFCRGFNLNTLDVSKELVFQLADIDCLVSKGEIDISNPRDLLFSVDMSKRNVYKFEVKTDTDSYRTRNVVYEVISHDSSGCLGESKADFIYYLFIEDINEDGSNIIKKEAWKITLERWRTFLRETYFSNKYDRRELNNKFGLRGNNFNKYGDKVANILCNIKKLEEYGIAKRVW